MKFAVIDVETTGLNPANNSIIEIGVVIIQDFKIIATYSKLVNSGDRIPEKITLLTGIDRQLLLDESGFEEIATEIDELTRHCILVGHNVQFDYSFLKSEMKHAGIAFTRKTLCTAELAQIIIPGLRSYSLASLCKMKGINNRRPHRALPDATATAALFLNLALEKGHDFIHAIFSSGAASRLIPKHLRDTVYKQLPATPGVYYFIGKNNKPIYIGKAANIKSRVLSHFRGEGNSLKILAGAEGIKEIRFQETGNDLLATLLEDHEIRHHWPGLNALQKNHITRFGIVYYMDQLLRWRMGITKGGKQHCFVVHFHQYHLATSFIREQYQRFRLDYSLCGLPSGKQVSTTKHNQNFMSMIEHDKANRTAEIFLLKGRNPNESGFIWVEQGRYKGFGFVPDKQPISRDMLLEKLTLRYSSITSENVIENLKKQELPSFTFQLK